jgi:hypothetical protein
LRSAHSVGDRLDESEGFKFGIAAIHAGADTLIDAIEAALADVDKLAPAA